MVILELKLGINEDTGETYTNIKALETLLTEEDTKEMQKAANSFVKGVYKIFEKNLENMKI